MHLNIGPCNNKKKSENGMQPLNSHECYVQYDTIDTKAQSLSIMIVIMKPGNEVLYT